MIDDLDWDDESGRPSGAPGWIAWVIVIVTLVFLFGLGGWLAMRPPSAPTATDTSTTSAEPTPEPSESDEGDKAEEKSASPEPSASEETTESSPTPTVTGDPVSLSDLATVEVPGAAPDNNDVDGTQVTFAGTNLLDGDPLTTWRMAGDRSGDIITFRFAEPVTITSVGMINGWAKTTTSTSGTDYDWYNSNRKVQLTEWIIDDQVFPQQLFESRDVQSLEITPTQTTEVQLRIVQVSPPGTPNPRDFTAISEVTLNGVAG